ncbi:MAG: [protein-PII] uridylyltransferase [Verrucomicrobiota bacterium]|nr:[protein-PII] uridylyltransferase [Verrucomicrobiota bacterium]
MPIEQEAPEFTRLRQHGEKKLVFPVGVEKGVVLTACKEFLKAENELLERMHAKGGGGIEVATERSTVMDELLGRLLALALAQYEAAHGPAPCTMTLCALGGYGRAEMCPYSDVDIMFLYPVKVRAAQFPVFQKYLADNILYMLWDLGLKVGHSTRDINAAIDEARKDVQTKNALLESRRIAGSKELFQQFSETYRKFLRKDDVHKYIQDRLEDQNSRRERMGNTVFLQEPDIKQGVGGLRDYQNIRWIVRLKLDIHAIEDLLPLNYLSKEEHAAFAAAYDYLLRVRTELHLESPRATDLLDLERQPSVAWRLGYKFKDLFARVEAFMKDYYRHAQCIYVISRYLEQRLALDSAPRAGFMASIEARRNSTKTEIDGFFVQKGRLFAGHNNIFEEEPERLIRAFRHAQVMEVELSFDLRRLITQNLPRIDTRVINSPTANKAFRSILQESGQVFNTLNQMLEIGVLPRFVPEFQELVCLVQHEYYHRYTADIHTLNTIRELDKIFECGEDPILSKYNHELHRNESPTLLYLILLLHDIGKGNGIKGHAIVGAEIASTILKRMGVNPELHDKIIAVIRHHLEMARFWQHYDLDDPRTTAAFAELVGTAEVLRYLYVHTYCDARGTAEGLWNSYKDTLHAELFRQTLPLLGEKPTQPDTKTMIPIETIKVQLPELTSEEIEAHYNLLPERYFIYSSVEEIVLHLRMVNQLLMRIAESPSMGSLVPVVEWNDDLSLGLTVVHVVTWDRAGLFYKLAGALSVAGLSIVSSKALSRADHITIDTFYVCEPGGGVVRNKKSREIFATHLDAALMQNRDLMPEIEAQAKRLAKPSFLQKQERLRAPIPPSVDVYHELTLKRTIIEIQANDTIGLLYRIARAIYEHGFDITFARIATERHVAVDTFYIEPVAPGKGEDTHALLTLRESLNRIVLPQVEAAAR